MSTELTLLVVGGYGIFGGRVVRLLRNEPRLRLIVAGRSAARAVAYCNILADARAELVPVAFDRDGDLAQQLAVERRAFQRSNTDCIFIVFQAITRFANRLKASATASPRLSTRRSSRRKASLTN